MDKVTKREEELRASAKQLLMLIIAFLPSVPYVYLLAKWRDYYTAHDMEVKKQLLLELEVLALTLALFPSCVFLYVKLSKRLERVKE